ncbi:UNKNOWN [Stylonychia lemnae]|uniref:Uncharacterized protein n=1 Tax=Stylonychia lemnae TaxID=5949 RepID=A0A078B276_STYLE|nr:UNKNOWN [Stylonychia lemnae]|eukprot:CDW88589.1 UNKNOWN [Stylonychia lemnae]
MMAQSIVKKNTERQNLIDLNKDKYVNSPYKNKLLKTRPPIIYSKDNNEHLFMLSEGERKVKAFTTSHYKVYGGKNRTLGTNQKIRQNSTQLDEFSFDGYKDVDELKEIEIKQRLYQQSTVSQHNQYMESPNIKDQRLFNQEQIEKDEKRLLRNALLLRKKHQANNGQISGSQSLMPGASSHMHQLSFDITQQSNNITSGSVFGMQKDSIIRQLDGSSIRNQGSQMSNDNLSYSQRPAIKRQRFSVVTMVDNSDKKELEHKLHHLKQQTLKKMETFNLRPPQKWVNEKLNQSSLTTTHSKQLNLKEVLNKRSQTPLQNNLMMIDRAQTQQKPMTAGSNTLNNTHSNLISSKGINMFQNRLQYDSPIKVNLKRIIINAYKILNKQTQEYYFGYKLVVIKIK